MRVAGFLLLLSGWVIVLAAVALLHPAAPQAWFVAAGMAVEILGLGAAARSYVAGRGGSR
jgi:ABC-type transport system involved in cytochrome bd biosynthesis fused ATPase/permease subunit